MQELDRWWQKLEGAGPKLVSRELFYFARAALDAGSHGREVERAFALADELQDKDPASGTYGNFRWYRFNDRPRDLNAVQFCMSAAALIWIDHKDDLTPLARQRLEKLMRLSVEGIRRHRVGVGYTNIFVKKSWNCIALGERLGMPALAEEGYLMLDEWIAFTWRNGITEYLSGTYYNVTMGQLENIAQYALRASGREAADAALALFWTQVGANWFAPLNRLSGPTSREYNFHRGADRGLRERLERALAGDGYLPGPRGPHWRGAATLAALMGAPREVRLRWGAAPGRVATNHVGERISVGSSAASYGPMDRALTVNIAAGKRTPFLNFLMDARGDPYSSRGYDIGSGHRKARHARPFLTSVQRGADVLLVACADPATTLYPHGAAPPLTCLLSHVTFPREAEVWIGDARAPDVTGAPADVPPDAPVFLRFGDAAVAVRFVVALDTSGGRAPVHIMSDAEGLKRGVLRITAEHATSRPGSRGTVALWLRAAEGLDDGAFARLRAAHAAAASVEARGDSLRVSVPASGGRLAVAVDLARRAVISTEGANVPDDLLLAVDGREVGRELLGVVMRRLERKARERAARLEAEIASGARVAHEAGRVVPATAADEIEGTFRVVGDPGAAGGRCVRVAPQGGTTSRGRATWLVRIRRAGRYVVWGRIKAPDGKRDSFFVSVRQGSVPVVTRAAWHTGTHADFEWTEARIGEAMRLDRGIAVIELGHREAGVSIDAVVIAPEGDTSWRATDRGEGAP